MTIHSGRGERHLTPQILQLDVKLNNFIPFVAK